MFTSITAFYGHEKSFQCFIDLHNAVRTVLTKIQSVSMTFGLSRINDHRNSSHISPTSNRLFNAMIYRRHADSMFLKVKNHTVCAIARQGSSQVTHSFVTTPLTFIGGIRSSQRPVNKGQYMTSRILLQKHSYFLIISCIP